MEVNTHYGFVYITTNHINNKKYIGQHKIGNRDDWYLGSGKLIKRAFEKYGRENFSKEILAYANSQDELNDLEINIIKLYNAVDDENFYNLAEGGHTNNFSNKNDIELKEIRNKIRNSLLGKKKSPESIKKRTQTRKEKNISTFSGKKHSDKTKEKLSNSMKKIASERDKQPRSIPVELYILDSDEKIIFDSIKKCYQYLIDNNMARSKKYKDKNIKIDTLKYYIDNELAYNNFIIKKLI